MGYDLQLCSSAFSANQGKAGSEPPGLAFRKGTLYGTTCTRGPYPTGQNGVLFNWYRVQQAALGRKLYTFTFSGRGPNLLLDFAPKA